MATVTHTSEVVAALGRRVPHVGRTQSATPNSKPDPNSNPNPNLNPNPDPDPDLDPNPNL